MGRNWVILWGGLLTAMTAPSGAAVRGGGGLWYSNMYIWRGFHQANHGTESNLYLDVSLSEHASVGGIVWHWSSFSPQEGGEWDGSVYAMWTPPQSKLTGAIAYTYFGGQLGGSTHTLLGKLTYQCPGQPSVAVLQDLSGGRDTFLTVAANHRFQVAERLTSTVTGSVCYTFRGEARQNLPDGYFQTAELGGSLDYLIMPRVTIGPRLEVFLNGHVPDQGRARWVGSFSVGWVF